VFLLWTCSEKGSVSGGVACSLGGWGYSAVLFRVEECWVDVLLLRCDTDSSCVFFLFPVVV
jgi:hypothetical protein